MRCTRINFYNKQNKALQKGINGRFMCQLSSMTAENYCANTSYSTQRSDEYGVFFMVFVIAQKFSMGVSS